jgi:hypothetical protein
MEIKRKIFQFLNLAEEIIVPHRSWSPEEYNTRNSVRLSEWLTQQGTTTQESFQCFAEFITALRQNEFIGMEALLVGSTTFSSQQRMHPPQDIDIRILFRQETETERSRIMHAFQRYMRDFLKTNFGLYDESAETIYNSVSVHRIPDPMTGAMLEQVIPVTRYDVHDPSFISNPTGELPFHISLAGTDKLPTPLYMEGEHFLGKSSGIRLEIG